MEVPSGRDAHTPVCPLRAWLQASGSYEKKGSCSVHECPSEPIPGLTVKQVCIGAWQAVGRLLEESHHCCPIWIMRERYRCCRGGPRLRSDTRASKKALTYESANGVEIPTHGEVVVPMQTEENTNWSMKLQATPRHETRCKRESDLVVFDQERSLIFDTETGEVNYVDEWITPQGESTFGQRRWSMATKHRVRTLNPVAESATG